MMPKAVTKGSMMQRVGALAFMVGMVIAVLAGFWQLSATTVSLLIVMGLLVGFLNVTSGESRGFLFTALVLVVVASEGGDVLGEIQVIGNALANMTSAIVAFVIPAAIIVAFREIYSYAHNS
jgi:hypothetical protein